MIITYFEWVFLALVIQHAMGMSHIVICGLPGCTIFFHVISQIARFSRGGGGILKLKYAFFSI